MVNLNSLSAALAVTVVLCAYAAVPGRAQAPATPAAVPSAASAPAAVPSEPPVEIPLIAPPPPELDDDGNGGATLARTPESFSELTLKGSELHAEPPLLGDREKLPNFTRELWQVRWRANDPIDLWIILPKGVKNPPVVLYLYSFPTETARFRDINYCNRLVAGGAAAVGFVSALTGHRTEHRPLKDTFFREMPEALASSVHDVQMILDYLQTRGDLDMARVGMFGQGSGGAIAAMAASVDPRLKALDLLNPWGDWPEWLAQAPGIPNEERAGFLTPEFEQPIASLDPVVYLPKLQSQKLRIQFVADEGEPKAVADRIAAAAPPSATVLRYDTAKEMYRQNSNGRLFAWIAGQLDAHPAPPQQSTAQSPAQPSVPSSLKSNP